MQLHQSFHPDTVAGYSELKSWRSVDPKTSRRQPLNQLRTTLFAAIQVVRLRPQSPPLDEPSARPLEVGEGLVNTEDAAQCLVV